MGTYIIFTGDNCNIGGLALYTVGKAKYLEKCGWTVYILCGGYTTDICAVSYLNKYSGGRFPFISYSPSFLSRKQCSIALNQICKYIGISINNNEEILIESQAEILALWAELLAEKLMAKHVCFNCNESFRGTNRYYEKYIDFFIFKYQRNELLGIHKDSLKKLFDGYLEIPCQDNLVFTAAEPDVVQDIPCEAIEQLELLDFNISYLGRSEKGYVPKIIEGVEEFSKVHYDKKIHFIMIGNAESRKKIIKERLGNLSNVKVTLLGDLIPIPKNIYEKIDVMIAGSGCAEISACMKVPTIVADCGNFMANGILGYNTMDSLFQNPDVGQSSFCDALEQVLIKKEYLKLPYAYPEPISSDVIYESHLNFFNKASLEKIYYPISQNIHLKGIDRLKVALKFHYPKFCAHLIALKTILKKAI